MTDVDELILTGLIEFNINTQDRNNEICIKNCCADMYEDSITIISQERELYRKYQDLIEKKSDLEKQVRQYEQLKIDVNREYLQSSKDLNSVNNILIDYKKNLAEQMKTAAEEYVQDLKRIERELSSANDKSAAILEETKNNFINSIMERYKARDKEYNNLLLDINKKVNEYSISLGKSNVRYGEELKKQKEEMENKLNKVIEDRNKVIQETINDLTSQNNKFFKEEQNIYNSKVDALNKSLKIKQEYIKQETDIRNAQYDALAKSLKDNNEIMKQRKEAQQKLYDDAIKEIKDKIKQNDELLIEILNEMKQEFEKRRVQILSGVKLEKNQINVSVNKKLEDYVDMYNRKKQINTFELEAKEEQLKNTYNKKIKASQEDINKNIDSVKELNKRIYSELDSVNKSYKNFSIKTKNDLDVLSETYNNKLNLFNQKYINEEQKFYSNIKAEMDIIESKRQQLISSKNKEALNILSEMNSEVDKARDKFVSTSQTKRTELAKLILELDTKRTQAILIEQKKANTIIQEMQDKYNEKADENEKISNEIKKKLKNKNEEIKKYEDTTNKLNTELNTGPYKTISENAETSNKAFYVLIIIAILLILKIISKK